MDAPVDAAAGEPVGGSLDETLLVARSRSGDFTAYDRLVAAYQDRVYQAAYRITGHHDDAWDAAQEAFLRAFRALRTFRGDAAFSTWMTRIAVNAALDVVRHRPRHLGLAGDGTSPAAADRDLTPGGDPMDEVLRREQHRRVQGAIAALPPDHRAVVVLRDIQGLSYEETARVLGVPVGTVRSRLSRARESLRTALADLTPVRRTSEQRSSEEGAPIP